LPTYAQEQEREDFAFAESLRAEGLAGGDADEEQEVDTISSVLNTTTPQLACVHIVTFVYVPAYMQEQKRTDAALAQHLEEEDANGRGEQMSSERRRESKETSRPNTAANLSTRKCVNQVKAGLVVARHDSITVAAGSVGVHKSTMSRCIHESLECEGYLWRFAHFNRPGEGEEETAKDHDDPSSSRSAAMDKHNRSAHKKVVVAAAEDDKGQKEEEQVGGVFPKRHCRWILQESDSGEGSAGGEQGNVGGLPGLSQNKALQRVKMTAGARQRCGASAADIEVISSDDDHAVTQVKPISPHLSVTLLPSSHRKGPGEGGRGGGRVEDFTGIHTPKPTQKGGGGRGSGVNTPPPEENYVGINVGGAARGKRARSAGWLEGKGQVRCMGGV